MERFQNLLDIAAGDLLHRRRQWFDLGCQLLRKTAIIEDGAKVILERRRLGVYWLRYRV